jgi:hypothetical protein
MAAKVSWGFQELELSFSASRIEKIFNNYYNPGQFVKQQSSLFTERSGFMNCPKCGIEDYSMDQPACSRCGYDYRDANIYLDIQAGNEEAFTSLVYGIVGLPVPFVMSIMAIVKGRKVKRLGSKSGFASAGIVLGIIGISIWALLFTAGAALYLIGRLSP